MKIRTTGNRAGVEKVEYMLEGDSLIARICLAVGHFAEFSVLGVSQSDVSVAWKPVLEEEGKGGLIVFYGKPKQFEGWIWGASTTHHGHYLVGKKMVGEWKVGEATP